MELTLVMAATTLLLVVLGFLSLNDEPRSPEIRAERPSGEWTAASFQARRG